VHKVIPRPTALRAVGKNLKKLKRLIINYFSGLGVSLDSDKPHLVGIDEDVLSTGITLYHLKDGDTSIGNDDSRNDIVLKSDSIEPRHCVINLNDGLANLIPQDDEALCMVNAVRCHQSTRLYQGCVIVLGKTNMFRYNKNSNIFHSKFRNYF
jgi:kinesin family protein 16B